MRHLTCGQCEHGRPCQSSLRDGGRQEAGEELADMATSGPKRNVNLPIFLQYANSVTKPKF